MLDSYDVFTNYALRKQKTTPLLNHLPSDRLVYDALKCLMERNKYCTHREVMERTGISHMTVKRAIKRLRAAGLVRLGVGGRGRGYAYEFPEV